MIRKVKEVNSNEIEDAFFEEIKKSLSGFDITKFSQNPLTYDKVSKDVLPLIQMCEVKGDCSHNASEHQHWSVIYKVEVFYKKSKSDDKPYFFLNQTIDKLTNYFNKTGLSIKDLDGKVNGIYVLGREKDEGLLTDLVCGEVYFGLDYI